MEFAVRFVPIVILITTLAGCSLSAASKSASTPVKSYHDPQYHFSFRYPAAWKAPTKGHQGTLQGVATYIVALTTPKNAAGVQVTVDHDVIPIPSFAEGRIAPDPSGGPDTFHYHHLKVSGWPAMQIKRYNGAALDGMFTIINTRTLSYQIEMITGQPPFSSQARAGYSTMVRTMTIPFS